MLGFLTCNCLIYVSFSYSSLEVGFQRLKIDFRMTTVSVDVVVLLGFKCVNLEHSFGLCMSGYEIQKERLQDLLGHLGTRSSTEPAYSVLILFIFSKVKLTI